MALTRSTHRPVAGIEPGGQLDARPLLGVGRDGILEIDDDGVGAARQRLGEALRAVGRNEEVGARGRGHRPVAQVGQQPADPRRRRAASGCARWRASSRRGSRRRGRPPGGRPCPRARRGSACCPGRPWARRRAPARVRPSRVVDLDLADPARRIGARRPRGRAASRPGRGRPCTAGSRQCASKSARPARPCTRDQAEHRAHRELRLVHRLRVDHRAEHVDRALVHVRGHAWRCRRPSGRARCIRLQQRVGGRVRVPARGVELERGLGRAPSACRGDRSAAPGRRRSTCRRPCPARRRGCAARR